MVKRSRSQSQEAPSLRSWRMIVPPYSSFHCQTRRMNSSRPSWSRVAPSVSRKYWTTLLSVAMPAWSVPGSQQASQPCIRRQRMRMSCKVLLRTWPMVRMPVTLGGGMTTA